MKIIMVTAALFLAVLPGCSDSEQRAEAHQVIEEPQARQIASGYWDEFIVGKYFLDAAGTRCGYCDIPPETWHTVTQTVGGWELVLDPPDGCYAFIEMDEYGEDVTVTRYGFSAD